MYINIIILNLQTVILIPTDLKSKTKLPLYTKI